jgi:hypothetical protein
MPMMGAESGECTRQRGGMLARRPCAIGKNYNRLDKGLNEVGIQRRLADRGQILLEAWR